MQEYKAVLEETFLSSWLGEDVEDKEEGEQGNQRRGELKGKKRKGEKRRLLKGGVSTLFSGDALMIRIVEGILGVTFWVTLRMV